MAAGAGRGSVVGPQSHPHRCPLGMSPISRLPVLRRPALTRGDGVCFPTRPGPHAGPHLFLWYVGGWGGAGLAGFQYPSQIIPEGPLPFLSSILQFFKEKQFTMKHRFCVYIGWSFDIFIHLLTSVKIETISITHQVPHKVPLSSYSWSSQR